VAKLIKLTPTSYAVLALVELQPGATPYELKQLLAHSIANFWPIPHTTFYEEPARLAGAGYLRETQEQGGRRRRRYELTADGRRALREWAADPRCAPQEVRDEALLKVFAGGDPKLLFGARLAYHQAKLEEFSRALEELSAKPSPSPVEAGARLTLLIGTTYHRSQLEMIEQLLAQAG